MGQVVITYEGRDFADAREIARELEIAGCVTWYRWRDGCVGPSFVGQCERRISEAGALIAVVSDSLDSPMTSSWLASDVETAHKRGKTIIFVEKEIAVAEIIQRRPEWSEACAAGVFIRVGSDGLRAMLPRLIESLREAGVTAYRREPLPPELAVKVGRYRIPAVIDVYQAIRDEDAAERIPREAAIRYKSVPLDNVGDVVVIAVSDPSVADEIRDKFFPFSHGIEPVLATESAILEAIERIHSRAD